MLVGAHAEVLDGLPGVALAAEEDGVRASRRTKRELVEGEHLTTSLQDALLGGSRETEGRNRELGNLQKTNIVRHGADDDDDLRVTVRRVRGLLDDAGKGNRGTVDLGEEKTVEDRLLKEHMLSPLHLGRLRQFKMTLLKSESVRLARKR